DVGLIEDLRIVGALLRHGGSSGQKNKGQDQIDILPVKCKRSHEFFLLLALVRLAVGFLDHAEKIAAGILQNNEVAARCIPPGIAGVAPTLVKGSTSGSRWLCTGRGDVFFACRNVSLKQ